MKYLNLTEGFNPYNSGVIDTIKYEKFFFNGGEPHIKINEDVFPLDELEDVTITSRLTSMNEFMMLLVATDALARSGRVLTKHLFIPYFPAARQDRQMVAGEPLTVKVFSEMINFQGFDSVTTFDNHSDVSTALLNNCVNVNNYRFVEYCLDDMSCSPAYNLISPDAGANKKINNLAQYLIHPIIIKCDKTRDVSNGNITGFEVYTDDLKGKDCVIVDDICDGGKTFVELSKVLKKKNAGDIYLIVSHGIFSKPLKELKSYFKKIYTTDSWRSEFYWEQVERDCTNLIKIIPFNEFIS